MKNSVKAFLLMFAVAFIAQPASSFANSYSLKLGGSGNPKIMVELTTGPFISVDSDYSGTWENTKSGLTGTIETYSKSAATGTQLIEFAWDDDGCPGSLLAIPIYDEPTDDLVINVIGGGDCDGPIGKFRIEFNNDDDHDGEDDDGEDDDDRHRQRGRR